MYANNVNKHQIESLKLKLQKFCLKKNISIKSLSLALIQAILCSCTPMAKNPELNSKSLDGIQNLDNSYYVDMPNQKIYFIASDNKPIDIEFSNINPIV